MKKDIYNKCTLHMHTCANIAVHRRPWTDLTNVKILAISLEKEKSFLFRCDPCQM